MLVRLIRHGSARTSVWGKGGMCVAQRLEGAPSVNAGYSGLFF